MRGGFSAALPGCGLGDRFRRFRACPASRGLPRPSACLLLGGTRSRPRCARGGRRLSSPGPQAQPSELAPVRFGPPSLRSGGPAALLSPTSADELRGGLWPWGFSRGGSALPGDGSCPRAASRALRAGSPAPRVCAHARAPVQGRLAAGHGGTAARGPVFAGKRPLRGSSGARPPPQPPPGSLVFLCLSWW